MTVRPGDTPAAPEPPDPADRDRASTDSVDAEAVEMETAWKALRQEIGQFADDSRAVLELETRLFVRNTLGVIVVTILIAALLVMSWLMLVAALVVWLHVAFEIPLAVVLALGGLASLLASLASLPLLKSLARGLVFRETRTLVGNALQAFTGRRNPRAEDTQ